MKAFEGIKRECDESVGQEGLGPMLIHLKARLFPEMPEKMAELWKMQNTIFCLTSKCRHNHKQQVGVIAHYFFILLGEAWKGFLHKDNHLRC